MIRHFLWLALTLVCALPASAQIQEQNVKTDIAAVKIYLLGAEVARDQKVKLPAGKHRLIFKGLSPRLKANSVTVTTSDNARILSITSQTNFLEPQPRSPRATVIQDSIELLTMRRDDLNNLRGAYDEEASLLQVNRQMKGNEDNLDADDLRAMSDFYRERFREILRAKTEINRELTTIGQAINGLNAQLQQMNAGNQPTSEVYLELQVATATTVDIKLRYLVDNAGWSPVYDLAAGSLDEPVKLTYRALAYNNTGIDWDEVKVSLSTADPNQTAMQPQLRPWVLRRGSSFALNSSGRNFVQEGRLNAIQNAPAMQLNDVAVRSKKEAALPTITLEQVEVNELSRDFEIDIPYSIPSDSKPYAIKIDDYELNASFRHYAVPKLDKDVFLLAQVTGWEDIDLIKGPMNIYHGERYIGKATLDTRTLNDTLDLSLGRDKNVIVTRTKQKEQSRKQLFGSDRTITLAYRLSVKNNYNRPISIDILDQLPIAREKEVMVSLVDKSGGAYDESNGIVTWSVNDLAPSKVRQFDFVFTIRHPKNQPIEIENKRTQYVPRYSN